MATSGSVSLIFCTGSTFDTVLGVVKSLTNFVASDIASDIASFDTDFNTYSS